MFVLKPKMWSWLQHFKCEDSHLFFLHYIDSRIIKLIKEESDSLPRTAFTIRLYLLVCSDDR